MISPSRFKDLCRDHRRFDPATIEPVNLQLATWALSLLRKYPHFCLGDIYRMNGANRDTTMLAEEYTKIVRAHVVYRLEGREIQLAVIEKKDYVPFGWNKLSAKILARLIGATKKTVYARLAGGIRKLSMTQKKRKALKKEEP